MDIDYNKLFDLKENSREQQKKSENDIVAENVEKEVLKGYDYKLEAFQVYKAHQEAIKKSEVLQCEILKGMNSNEDITTLFLKACEVVSLITGTKEFYTQIKRKIEALGEEERQR